MTGVEYSREAREMMAAIDDWWIGEHGFIDNPLWDELEATTAMLVRYPNSGELAGRAQHGGLVRRRLFSDQRWHVYYTYDDSRAVIAILAVWYASRGRRPEL